LQGNNAELFIIKKQDGLDIRPIFLFIKVLRESRGHFSEGAFSKAPFVF